MDSHKNSIWIFGYGSLMWSPGFSYLEKRRAQLDNYRRYFGLLSCHYRGTVESPGLVLGLDQEEGSSCIGVAYLVTAEEVPAALAYLHEREMITYAYRELHLAVHLFNMQGEPCVDVQAICYVLDPEHPQYAGEMTEKRQVEIIAGARGSKGENWKYLAETMTQLEVLGVYDKDLERIWKKVEARVMESS